MKKTSKILAIILAILMIISIIPLTANAENSVLVGTCGNNITWVLDKSTGLLVISGSGKMQNYTAWHDYNDYVKEIIIQDGITSIANTSFYASEILTKVTIPDSVKTIGSSAFFLCSKLETVIMGNGITNVGVDAFDLCFKLKDVFYSGTKDQWKAITIGEFNSPLKNATIHYENVVDKETHTYVSVITKAPTCTDKGVEIFVCSICSDTYKVQTDALGHTKVSTPVILPTTTQPGCSYDERCSVCGEIYVEGQIIPALDETLTTGVWGDSSIIWVFDSSTGTLTLYGNGALDEYSAADQPSWIDIKQVVINEGITEIGSYVFYGCTNIESVIFPQSIEKIKVGAFSDFCDVDTIYYKGTETQWNHVKESSNNTGLSLPTVYFEYGVTYSGSCGDDVTWLYDACLRILTISGTGDMYDYASDEAKPWQGYRQKIKKVIVNEGVTSIGTYAFSYLGATEIILPDSLTTISAYSFNQCYYLESLVIPENVTTIGNYAFFQCGLTDINIPASVTIIGQKIFQLCTSLKRINVDSYNQYFSSDEYGVLFNKDKTQLIKYPANSDEVNYIIPEGVTEICEYAFAQCSHIESLTIPVSMEKVYPSLFDSQDEDLVVYYAGTKEQYKALIAANTNDTHSLDKYTVICLDEIVYPHGKCGENLIWSFNTNTGVLTISGTGEMCEFEYSNHWGAYSTPWYDFTGVIKTIVVEDGVTSISEGAFYRCSSVENIIIGSGLKSIGEYAFSYCFKLENITVGKDNQYFVNDEYGVLFNKDKTILMQYPIGNPRESYTIPDSVVTIGENAFENCNYLTKVVIGINTKTISAGAFDSSTNLKKIVFSDSVTRIERWAFGDCGELETVVIGSGVTYIGEFAFGDCTNLKSIVIPDSVITIDDYAFDGCDKLQEVFIGIGVNAIGSRAFNHFYPMGKVYYAGTVEQWKAIYKGDPNFFLSFSIIHYNYHMHKYISVVTEPTCTERGYTTYTCECGDSYIDDYVDTLGHSYTSEITTPTTHFATGVMTYTCTCGDTYTETIEKLVEHNYNVVVTAPTCTEQGYTTYTCECGDTYVDDYVDTLGHTPANAVEENYVAPTCTEQGSVDKVIYCSVCDKEISRETVTLETSNHEDNDGDGNCDACDEQLCDHICHKLGITGFVWRIINIFNMLFGLNETCECGVAHY